MEYSESSGRRPHAAAVASMYGDLIDLYEMSWDRYGHKSIHCGYYERSDDDERTAARNTIRVVADAADIEPESRVLNVGCGAGDDSVWLADTFRSRVVGVDLSEAHLAVAREHAAESDVADLVSYRKGDFHELETVAENAFDTVWALESICHSTDERLALKRFREVLADGGRLVVADWFRSSGTLSKRNRNRMTEQDELLNQRTTELETIRGYLDELGYRNVTVRDITDGVAPGIKARYRMALLSYPLHKFLSMIGRGTRSHVAVTRASIHMHRLVKSGAQKYCIITADCG